jgi:Flp pilus assembly protein TadD
MAASSDSRVSRLICLALVLGSVLVYGRLLFSGFVDFDDGDYVLQNPHVNKGLSFGGAGWAFTTGYDSNWHPMTWLSHMVDCQLYGLSPAGHHLTNLLLHVANALLLFRLLREMTGAVWRSGLVAALFAWHPLHVESVAWIAERKDVLSTCFWLLAVLAYARYAREAKEGVCIKNSNYLLALLFFALGLMSKPMVVTLPFVLLLLDWWPLKRSVEWRAAGNMAVWLRMVMEKAPFIVLAAASGVATFLVQRHGGAMTLEVRTTFAERVANALVSYVRYLGKMIWPVRLAVFYPQPGSWPAWWVIAAAVVLLAVSGAVVAGARRRPYLPVGWLWYLGMLVPVIGLVQVGGQAMADRYTYLPLVGVFIMLVWGAADLGARWSRQTQLALRGGGALALAVCLGLTWFQVSYWHDGVALFSRQLRVTPDNFVGRDGLGAALQSEGRFDEATEQYEISRRLEPRGSVALCGLGMICARRGRDFEAVKFFRQALELRPDFVSARYNLGRSLAAQGRFDEAIDQYRECARQDPENSDIHYNLANALLARGYVKQAAAEYRECIRFEPDAADAHNNLAAVLVRTGDLEGAAHQLREALRIKPAFPEAEDQLGVVLERQGNLDQARLYYEKAIEHSPKLVHARLKLGQLLVQGAQLNAARQQFARVIELEPTNALAYFDLGGVWNAQGKYDEAATAFEQAARLQPDDAEIPCQLGGVLTRSGRYEQAVAAFQQAARLRPDWPEPLCGLADLLASSPVPKWRDGAEAVRLAERAQKLSGGENLGVMAVLERAYAGDGRIEDAIRMAEAAGDLADAQGQHAAAEAARERVELYRKGKANRE